jgi:hypothetical protein
MRKSAWSRRFEKMRYMILQDIEQTFSAYGIGFPIIWNFRLWTDTDLLKGSKTAIATIGKSQWQKKLYFYF